VESGYREARCGRWQLPEELPELFERFHDGEELWERHGAK